MRSLTTFREPLRKNQIMDLALEDVNKALETAKSNPVENQIFFKRLKVYVDSFINGNETHAIDEFNKIKRDTFDGVNVSFTQGGAILDYDQDMIYSDLAAKLKERKMLLDLAFKMTDDIFDNEGVQVPKVKVKNYRKDSLNVRL